MLKGEKKCNNITKDNIIYRASLRGLKKCPSCGFFNGQRGLICRNVKCDLRVKKLAAFKPYDPIQLITFNHARLYSLRSKEKLLQPRNFVKFSGTTEAPARAVCYVDNCKYDVPELDHLVCRHIKACKVSTIVPPAECYPIDKSILWNLNIPIEQKQFLWNLYQMEEKIIPPVQKLNSSIFVVKCLESTIFPAGRLHVTVFSNKTANKSGTYSCSCKKLKIILEQDNSVTMKPEICDHMLLLLAAILNKPDGKTLYGKFLEILQHLWMPTSLNTPILDCRTRSTEYMDYDLSLASCNEPIDRINNVRSSEHSDDILFNFKEELFAENVNNIPDFYEVILDVNNDQVTKIQNINVPKLQAAKQDSCMKDPKLKAVTTNRKDEDMDLKFLPLNSPPVATTEIKTDLNLTESFQLNHNVQVLNDSMELAKDIERLSNVHCPIMNITSMLPTYTPKQKSLLKTAPSNSNTEKLEINPSAIIKTESIQTRLSTQKFKNFKQVPVKVTKIDTPQSIQISQINTKNYVPLQFNQTLESVKQISNNSNNIQTIPSLSYDSWLDYVIEVLNENITIQDVSTSIKSTFHVPDAIFNYFSKSFTLSDSKRLPNFTSILKCVKYKNQIKYNWDFNEASTVQRIFTSKNTTIVLERSYERLANGSYKLSTPTKVKSTDNYKFRPICPKIQLYKAFMQFDKRSEICDNYSTPYKCGLKLGWLPSAFPKSSFGLMTVEYFVSVEKTFGTM